MSQPADDPRTEPEPTAPSPSSPPDGRKSFSILIRQHHRELLVYARALTADHDAAQDIVQEAFVTAYQKLDTFDVSRDFGAWVRGIVRNHYRVWRRRQKRAPLTEAEVEAVETDIAAWQAARIRGSQSVFDVLEHCLENLPQTLRAAVDSFYFQDAAGSDAAEALGISDASLRKRLERARGQLHECVSRKTAANPPASRSKLNIVSIHA